LFSLLYEMFLHFFEKTSYFTFTNVLLTFYLFLF